VVISTRPGFTYVPVYYSYYGIYRVCDMRGEGVLGFKKKIIFISWTFAMKCEPPSEEMVGLVDFLFVRSLFLDILKKKNGY